MVLRSRPNWRRHVTTAQKRNSGGVDVVALSFRWSLDVNSIQVNAHLLVLNGTMIQMIWQLIFSRIRLQIELVVYLDWHNDVSIQAHVLGNVLSWTDHALERAIRSLCGQAITTRIIFAEGAIWPKYCTLLPMLAVVRHAISFYNAMR